MKKIFLLSAITLVFLNTEAQVTSDKLVGKKNQATIDSLKTTDYPYALPIWGDKVTKKGYALPYSAGVSLNYFWQTSDIIIDNLSVGFNGSQMVNLDQNVKFEKALSVASATTVRPDIWLFPFLNVYGILGQAQASTDIGIGFYVYDSTNTQKKVFSMDTKVDFKTTTFGFGITPTIGIGGGFLALDMNTAWTDVPQLSKPARSFVFGPRFGKNFNLKKPESKIAIWAGGFRVHISSETNGSLPLAEVLPPTEWETKIQQGYEGVAEAQQQVDMWWDGLSPAEQKNPINVAKYNTAQGSLAKAGELINGAESALTKVENSTVQYSMAKRPKDAWNFIVGAQYQLNKHWMIRAEYGFLASRTQLMFGLQFRFGL